MSLFNDIITVIQYVAVSGTRCLSPLSTVNDFFRRSVVNEDYSCGFLHDA